MNKNLLDTYKDLFYKNNHYNHTEFYKMQRRRLNILMNKNGTPKGGKWSFDSENRQKIPIDIKIPNILDLVLNSNQEKKLWSFSSKNISEQYNIFIIFNRGQFLDNFTNTSTLILFILHNIIFSILFPHIVFKRML